MARTESTMLELGTAAPNFSLPDTVTGNTISLDDFSDRKALLVMFISRHCPFVKHVLKGLSALGKDYESANIGIVAVSSNDIDNYPDDAPELLKQMAIENDFRFPVCFDETQQTATAYTAACTPDFFLFDADRKLVYRGQLDASRPDTDIPVTGKDLRAAIDAVLADTPVSPTQYPSIGCNIKWKAGNEPPYFAH
ncbi:MAG: thioredoxin family protein [Deltaproteobacteria bacterium]|nr:thioredoxin family protein [Deltaproteobacteria bacterium]